jgi:hypothetical protein
MQTMEIIGQEACIQRIKNALQTLKPID